jgi:hypothetical protein
VTLSEKVLADVSAAFVFELNATKALRWLEVCLG